MPTLEMVFHTVTLHAGDQVTSSGDGGLLPAGLPVGTLVSDGQGGFRVALLSDPAASQDVEILNFAKPPETPPANAQLPAEAAGLKPEAPPPSPTSAAAAKPQVPPAPAQQTAQPKPAQSKPIPAAPSPETAATAAPGESEDADR